MTSAVLAGLLFLLSAGGAKAADTVQLSRMDPVQTGYATPALAVTAALQASAALSTTVEYAGAVYTNHGAFFFTIPVTNNSETEVSGFRIAISASAKLVALYHTHPQSARVTDNSELFSAADVVTAKQMNVPSYIGVVKTGDIRSFTPGHDHPVTTGSATGVSSGFSYGTLFVAKAL